MVSVKDTKFGDGGFSTKSHCRKQTVMVRSFLKAKLMVPDLHCDLK